MAELVDPEEIRAAIVYAMGNGWDGQHHLDRVDAMIELGRHITSEQSRIPHVIGKMVLLDIADQIRDDPDFNAALEQ